jgi:hypothetical protein
VAQRAQRATCASTSIRSSRSAPPATTDAIRSWTRGQLIRTFTPVQASVPPRRRAGPSV